MLILIFGNMFIIVFLYFKNIIIMLSNVVINFDLKMFICICYEKFIKKFNYFIICIILCFLCNVIICNYYNNNVRLVFFFFI